MAPWQVALPRRLAATIKSGAPPCPHPARALPAPPFAFAAAVLFVAACGQSQQGEDSRAFRRREVTTVTSQPKTIPATYEYVGQTTGSKEVEVRARVTGILEQKLFQEGAPVKAGQVLFVIDPKPLQAQAARARGRRRARAGAEGAGRPRGRAPEAARRAARGRAEGSRRRGVERRARRRRRQGRRGQARRSEAEPRLHARRRADHRLSSRAPKSEGSLVTANDTLLTTISQVDPMWVPFAISENEQLALNRAVSEGRLTLPKDNAFDVTVRLADGSIVPAPGPDQLRRHAHQSVDRHVRNARRDSQRRRRC